MKRETAHSPSGFAQWTILMLGLAVLGLAVGANLFFERGRMEKREQDRLLLDARIIQRIVDANLISLNAVLVDLERIVLQEGLPVDIDKRLTILTDALPGVRTLTIFNANGVVTASNMKELVGKNFSHREYFQTLRERRDPELLYISPPFKTALGAYTMILGRMLSGPGGTFLGIVTATLDPEFFIPLLDSVLYAPDVWTNLVHGSGVIFLMRPGREGMAGKNINQPGALFSRHVASGRDENVFSETVYATGEDRMLAARTIAPQGLHLTPPLVIGVSRDLAAVYEPWRKDLSIHGVLYALTVMLSVAFLYLYQKRQRENDVRLAKAAFELRQREHFIRTVTDNIPGLVAYWDADLRCRYANKAYEEWFGKTTEQMRGISIKDLLGPALFAQNEPYILAALRGEPQVFERTLTKTGGGRGYTLARYIPDRMDGGVKGFYVLVSDVTELKTTQLELEKRVQELDALASADPLTGIPNRRSLLTRLETEYARSKRYGAPLAFLMIDVDHFKAINDQHGHDVGDAILIMLAETLKEAMRATDMAGRLGGEEFGAILAETSLDDAIAAAERLREGLSRVCIPTKAGSTCFTVSIGVAAYGPQTGSAQILMKHADLALYQAKDSGRNRVVPFDASMAENV